MTTSPEFKNLLEAQRFVTDNPDMQVAATLLRLVKELQAANEVIAAMRETLEQIAEGTPCPEKPKIG